MYSHLASADSRQGGFAIVTALILALLFLVLVFLILADSSEALRTAERVRGRIMADILAENGAEMVAEQMVAVMAHPVDQRIEGGRVTARYHARSDGRFAISSEAVADGVFAARASVELEGLIEGERVRITRSRTRPGHERPSEGAGSEGGLDIHR